MDIVDIVEGYEFYDNAMAAYDILDKVYNGTMRKRIACHWQKNGHIRIRMNTHICSGQRTGVCGGIYLFYMQYYGNASNSVTDDQLL